MTTGGQCSVTVSAGGQCSVNISGGGQVSAGGQLSASVQVIRRQSSVSQCLCSIIVLLCHFKVQRSNQQSCIYIGALVLRPSPALCTFSRLHFLVS